MLLHVNTDTFFIYNCIVKQIHCQHLPHLNETQNTKSRKTKKKKNSFILFIFFFFSFLHKITQERTFCVVHSMLKVRRMNEINTHRVTHFHFPSSFSTCTDILKYSIDVCMHCALLFVFFFSMHFEAKSTLTMGSTIMVVDFYVHNIHVHNTSYYIFFHFSPFIASSSYYS